MHIVILAAGRGTRIGPLTDNIPKALLPIADQTVINRLIKQVRRNSNDLITIVTGHGDVALKKSVTSQDFANIRFILNDRYLEDVNIWSLYLAVENIAEDTLIIEGDIVADQDCIDKIFDVIKKPNSFWFTHGKIKSPQYGGVLKTDVTTNKVNHLELISQFNNKYSDFKKTIGILHIGKKQIAPFTDLLKKYSKDSIKHYYMVPWIENLKLLECYEHDLFDQNIKTFNSLEEYNETTGRFR